MAPPRSAYEQWREKSSEVLKEVLPRGYIPEFPPLADYTISLKMWLHPNPGPFGKTFGHMQIVGMFRYNVIADEWWGTTTGPNDGWVLYPDLASAAISMCAAHRLKGN